MNGFPDFLKRIDFFMLVNRPLMWRTRVHYFLIYGFLANSLLFLILATIDLSTDFLEEYSPKESDDWLFIIIFIIPMLLLMVFWKDKQEPLYNIKHCWMVIAGYTMSWLCYILFFAVLVVLFILHKGDSRYLVGVNLLLFSIPLGVLRFILYNYIKVNLIKILFVASIGFWLTTGVIFLMIEFPTTVIFILVFAGVAFLYQKRYGIANLIELLKQGVRYFLIAFAFSLSIAVCGLLFIIAVTDELNSSEVLIYSYSMLFGFYLLSWGLITFLNKLYIMPRLIN